MTPAPTSSPTGAVKVAAIGSRRLMIASLLLALFVLFDLGLLGWLSFRSLSQREIERVLLETRSEAEELARELAGSAHTEGDLYTLIAVEQETQSYIDSILKSRDIVQDIEIRDHEGKLVFKAQAQLFSPARDPDAAEIGQQSEIAPRTETRTVTREEALGDGYDVNVPIGELGFLHIGISQVELQRRVGILRQELVRQTALIGAVTLLVLVLAYLTIWRLWTRGRRLEAQAVEAERLAYIGTLASGLAHEIRNPLNSLNLNIQLLEEEAGIAMSGHSSRRLLAITQEEIARLERLVTDFLLYAKPRPLDLDDVRAAELLERCRDLLGEEFGVRGVTLDVQDRTGGARVRVDSGQMTQLLVNLAQNALAATEGTRRKPRVTLSGERRGSQVVLEVGDNGAGIRPEDRERIFDVFYSRRKGGTGLGLAVVRRIANDHGGEIEVHSVPGSGTRIRVLLEEAAASGEGVRAGGQPEPTAESVRA